MSSKNNKIREGILNNIGFHLRTPMSSIINLLHLLESTTVTGQKEYIDGLKTSMYDLNLMVNSMLNYVVTLSDDINVQKEAFNTKEFLESILKLIKIKLVGSNLEGVFGSLNDLPTKAKGDSKKYPLFYSTW
jgi:Signal transduction histidine kinase